MALFLVQSKMVLPTAPKEPTAARTETLTAFDQANKTAREQFTGYLAAKPAAIRLVEYTFSNNPITRDGHGPA